MGLKNVMKAREQNGTKIVHVDVRYTRTSKIADEFFQLRPGTDIAFMGYIISQMLEREKFNKDYVLRNTNAACLLRDDFSFHDGLFSGFDEAKKSYTDKKSWGYALGADGKPQKADDLFALPVIQSAILENAARYVKPGGILLYSTCTILPEENEQITDAFLAEHSDFARETASLPAPIGKVEGQLTFWPQRHGTDGFYICRMKRHP